jgi:peptidoglycan-N-acetylglucosamine deacetylase
MVIRGCISVRIAAWAALCFGLAGLAAQGARAAECPGHPDAIGTSRTIVVDPREHPRVGTMQYPETLPLRDHEVVLTFDDGPLPRNSNKVLQILADNCAKATFFLIGQQARAYPDGVRKLIAAGHTIGSHSQNHPLTFQKMSDERVRQEVDDGITSVMAALTDASGLAPFFRVPGLLRAKNVEDYLASKGIQVWSVDFLADDWRHISSAKVYDLAIKRLEAQHKGILLLHDIQARTVAALPKILHEMKLRGYHIVQVVPATAERPATPTEPQEWRQHPAPEALPVAEQPQFPTFVIAEAERLVMPMPSDFSTPDTGPPLSAEPSDQVRRPLLDAPTAAAAWPNPAALPPAGAAAMLPAPSASLFAMSDKAPTALPLSAGAHRGAATETRTPSPAPRAISALKPSLRARAQLARQIQGQQETAGTRHETKPRAPRRGVKVASLKKRQGER